MTYREISYRWEFDLKSSPEKLWPLVSDTNRFNLDTGLPSVEHLFAEGESLTNARRHLRLSLPLVSVEWEEEPFEWVQPHRFGVVRRYLNGLIAEMRVLAEMTPVTGGGTHLVYSVTAQPRTWLGIPAVKLVIGGLSARKFSKVFQEYDEMAAASYSSYSTGSSSLAPGGNARLSSLTSSLITQGSAPELVSSLAKTVEDSDDLTAMRLRPYVMADDWNAGRRDVLELCLDATRAGLLNSQWELLCPLCRGSKQTARTLEEVDSDVHCDTCNIDFRVNFDQQVELTFQPNPSVRKVIAGDYCVGGPQVTPHIVVQQLIAPGDSRTLTTSFDVGRYRLRTLGLPGGQIFRVASDGLNEFTLVADESGWAGEELSIANEAALHFENKTEDEQLFVLERMTWSDRAATAAEVTALQRFRDLFGKETLRPGEEISMGSMTHVFTDLSGSTALYREIGDAPAFGLVIDHFQVLLEAVKEHDGAIVKTVGDAIHAVFHRPVGAFNAMLAAQYALANPSNDMRALKLKAGIHLGPCIAATVNERLDYFGAAVNIAARLEGFSTGEDIIISDAVYADPEIQNLLKQHSDDFSIESLDATMKGYEQEHFKLWRVEPSREAQLLLSTARKLPSNGS